MEIIYRTFDGVEFYDLKEAEKHEALCSKDLVMWDREGVRRSETSCAFVVYLANEVATKIFLDMAKKQGDSEIVGINKDDYGLFLFDEWNETYRYIDEEEQSALYAAMKYLRGDN